MSKQEAILLLSRLQQTQRRVGLIIMNLCLNACRKARNLNASLRLYDDMLERSERPDLLSYTSLIVACGASKDWQLALQLHQVGEPFLASI